MKGHRTNLTSPTCAPKGLNPVHLTLSIHSIGTRISTFSKLPHPQNDCSWLCPAWSWTLFWILGVSWQSLGPVFLGIPLPHYLFLSTMGWTLCLQHFVLFDRISVVLEWKHKRTPTRHLLILCLSNIYILNVDRFNFFPESDSHYRTSNICTWQRFRIFMSESILLCSHLLLIIPNVWGFFDFHMKVFVCFF